MAKSRISVALYVALVFGSGALFGAFAHRLYMVNSVVSGGAPAPHKRNPEEFRRRYVQDIRTQVKLDDQQVKQLGQILDQTEAEFHQMNAKMRAEGQAIENVRVEKINAMLREDQRPLFAKFRADREAERERERKRRQAQGK
jgi:hypothetical protein